MMSKVRTCASCEAALVKILVVEDDLIILEFLSLFLESEGMDVVTATGGEEALRVARTEHPNAVLCDLHMARVSGLEVLHGLRQDPDMADTPFVMITADQSADLRRRSIDLGASAFVVKPFNPDHLIDTLHKIAPGPRPLYRARTN